MPNQCDIQHNDMHMLINAKRKFLNSGCPKSIPSHINVCIQYLYILIRSIIQVTPLRRNVGWFFALRNRATLASGHD